jgi:peptide/nickel transport system substrate-binding protein
MRIASPLPRRAAPALLAALLATAGGAACRGPEKADESFGISTPYLIESLDPHARDLHAEASVCANLYEPLVARDAELKLRPALALRWLSPSPTTWVFELRPGVVFHDGRPFGAADVVATFERLRTHPELQRSVSAKAIDKVTALDPLRVEFHTARPAPSLLNALSLIAILPQGQAESARPVGTGPYAFAEWRSGESVRLVRHETYWGDKPSAQEVLIRLDRKPEQAADDLRSGKSRLAILGSRRAGAALGGDKNVRIERQTGLFLKFLGFDLSSDALPDVTGVKGNPFKNPLVRRALSLAIDRRLLAQQIAEPALPAYQLVPPVVFGHNPALPEIERNLEQARELLRRAGYPDGFGMTLRARRVAGSAAPAVAAMLADVGVRASVVELDEAAYAASSGGAYLARLACETGDAADLLPTAMQASSAPTLAAMGGGGSRFMRAIQESIESDSPEVRGEALRQIMAAAAETLPLVPLYFDEDVYGVSAGWRWRPRADGYVLAADATPSSEGGR